MNLLALSNAITHPAPVRHWSKFRAIAVAIPAVIGAVIVFYFSGIIWRLL